MDGISVKLPTALSSVLAAEARRRNVTQSTIIRESLERYLSGSADSKNARTCADLVRDLMGSVRSGRHDLATNKTILQAQVGQDYRRERKRHR